MANAAVVSLVEGAASTVTTPAAGKAAIGVDSNDHLFVKNPAGNLWIPALSSSLAAATAGINTTETLINAPLAVPVGLLRAGVSIRFTFWGTTTDTGANATTFTLRAGTAGTTADASVGTWVTGVSGTTGTNIPFKGVITYTIRTAGAPGTGHGALDLVTNATTGIVASALSSVILPTGATGLNTTTATFIDLTVLTAAATTTHTIQGCLTEVLAA